MNATEHQGGTPPLDAAEPDATPPAALRHDAASDAAAGTQGDPSPADPGAGDEPDQGVPLAPEGRLRRPEDPNGCYVILWAPKPKRGDKSRPAYREAAYVRASTPDVAKRRVVEADDDTGAYLRHQAGISPGILVRAVPAGWWADQVEATTLERPAPILVVR